MSWPPEISCPDGLLVVERLARLIDVGELDARADADLAGVGLLGAGQHAKQRGLAGAVRADDADDAAARQAEVADCRSAAARRSPCAEPCDLDHQFAQPRAGRNVDFVGLVALLEFPARPVPRSAPGAPCSWPGAPWGWCAPIRARAPGSCAAPRARAPRAPGASPSAPATRSSCPARECHGRDRARESTWRRCRGSSDRASPRPRCSDIPPDSAPATPPIPHPGGWWARRAAACPAATAAAGTAPRGASRRPRAARSSPPTAAGAARRRRFPACAPAPSRRRRRSHPAASACSSSSLFICSSSIGSANCSLI